MSHEHFHLVEYYWRRRRLLDHGERVSIAQQNGGDYEGQNHIGGLRPLACGIGNTCEGRPDSCGRRSQEPAREIAELFRKKTGHKAIPITGASGAFYTQITHGDQPRRRLSRPAE